MSQSVISTSSAKNQDPIRSPWTNAERHRQCLSQLNVTFTPHKSSSFKKTSQNNGNHILQSLVSARQGSQKLINLNEVSQLLEMKYLYVYIEIQCIS